MAHHLPLDGAQDRQKVLCQITIRRSDRYDSLLLIYANASLYKMPLRQGKMSRWHSLLQPKPRLSPGHPSEVSAFRDMAARGVRTARPNG